jgi:hypothetical protein
MLEGANVHEGKHLSADGEWEGNDEKHEECHLCYEQEEDLCANVLAASSGGSQVSQLDYECENAAPLQELALSTYKAVVERHVDGLTGFTVWEKVS